MATSKLDKRLRSLLAKRKTLEPDILDEALSKADSTDAPLTSVLLEDDLLAEADLLTILSEETGLPPINAEKIGADDRLAELLPENLAIYYGVAPVARVGQSLTLAVSDPFDILQLDDIQIVTGCSIRPVLSTDAAIRKAIPSIYSKDKKIVQDLIENMSDGGVEVKETVEEVEEIGTMTEGSDEAPVVKLVNLIIVQGVQLKASDIHIEPLEKRIRVRYRTDGKMREVLSPPKSMQSAMVSRIKIIAGLDIAEKRKPQDGKFQIRLDGRKIDFRVSILPITTGEKVVLRILDSSNLSLSLDSLGFETAALSNIRTAIHQPYGMLLVTGPTGSGKSTTLYSSIREVLSEEENIVTVEDPVEYALEGVNQVQVNVKRGLTFAAALRSILRQDPDTVLIGEIRDQETIEIAVKAALTGHLVFSTLHTNDAPSTITRMVDMGVDPFLVASSVQCVAAQRLGRKICEHCRRKVEVLPPVERLLDVGFREDEIQDIELYEAVGCPRCNQRGFKGRFALLETLPLNEDLRRLIISGGSAIDIKRLAMEQGMISLRRCGLLNAMRGRTSLEEVLSVTVGDK